MQLRWTEEAVADLEHIAGYLLTHTPSRAQNLIRAVYEAPSDLLTFPNRGRQGKKEGTRELVPIVRLREMGDVLHDSIRRPRLLSQTVGIFAGLAPLIAVVGTYGLPLVRGHQSAA
ncbi:MAG TPA: type II toxin-antitoxin system RelE/ParE family toxin [Gemmatimonadaceae bacterium]|nr:type II toxin-antitoxin system RelE/ParE family toxin [Gemmatimonadaceae bacterium]